MTDTPRTDCELAIVGGGPAGLAAAALAAELGVETILFDEQPTPGGQIYRNIEANSRKLDALSDILGADHAKGLALVERFRSSGAAYEPLSSIWQVTAAGKLGVSQKGRAYLTRAGRIILATGAVERPFPVPGWTLPGVMGAGAAQTLMKASGVVPDRPTVIAGSGPLTYLVAFQLMKARAPLTGVIDTSRKGLLETGLTALPVLPGFAGDLLKGLSWMAALRRARIPVFSGRNVAAEGGSRVEAVTFEGRGKRRRLPASLLLLHEGVVPNNQITASLRCRHVWDAAQMAWRPWTDEWGVTSAELVAVAGDGAGISGARAAVHGGRLAALDAACRIGRISRAERDERARPERQHLQRDARFRAFLDNTYRPNEAVRRLANETIACRCEEVTAGDLRALVAEGFTDINQLKSFSRCGMGQCQGRMCGATVARILAQSLETDMESVGYYRLRLPVKPLPVAQLAELGNAERDLRPSPLGADGDPSQRV
ncbi:NAD(P)/FAD-dependent oxidoreductase [Mesorhizobium sp. B2-3-5]|uniref:FAD/NAD(P)-dependent oxidoreductase n=1 Tax=Mesorhizobium sp. B2-3-5 TaxID=2589958 RepID=UPI0011291EF0|nr:NAD(P)/FAD-dependent oxidoreductase [Mesorhizobium sp. B2-3-5]TPM17128.1 FAD-dependent oxidoreductase [Mesorhizobium sp. B2-3-5]